MPISNSRVLVVIIAVRYPVAPSSSGSVSSSRLSRSLRFCAWGVIGWSPVLCQYLAPEAPTAVLGLTDGGGWPQASVICDATGSAAPLHGLHEEPYRFFSDGEEAWTTEWLSSPQHTQILESPGAKVVQLEVRDRWEQTTVVQQEITLEIGDPPPATTPNILMANFKASYEEMLSDPFTEMLHPDFKMILSPGTLDEWGWDDGFYFDRTDMAAIHANLFGGEPGEDADGNTVHPIDSIVVDLLYPMGAWSPIPEEDLYFGENEGQWANYMVIIRFWNTDLSHNFKVQQSVNFYVAEVTENESTEYQLLGIRGLIPGRKSEEITWDGFLAIYR